jgi:hypothetical protein
MFRTVYNIILDNRNSDRMFTPWADSISVQNKYKNPIAISQAGSNQLDYGKPSSHFHSAVFSGGECHPDGWQ